MSDIDPGPVCPEDHPIVVVDRHDATVQFIAYSYDGWHMQVTDQLEQGTTEVFLSPDDRLALARQLLPSGAAIVADPAGLWAFIDNAIGWIPVDPEDREAMRQTARKMLGLGETQ